MENILHAHTSDRVILRKKEERDTLTNFVLIHITSETFTSFLLTAAAPESSLHMQFHYT